MTDQGDVARCLAIYYTRDLPARQAEDLLYELPVFSNIVKGGHPGIPSRLPVTCPADHHIVTVVMESDHNWHPFLLPATENDLENGRQVVFNAEQHSWRARIVCAEHGCPEIIPEWPTPNYDTGDNGPHAQYCDRHRPLTGDEIDETGAGRMHFRCPADGCRYDGTKRQHKLWALYTLAVLLGAPAIRLPD